MESESSQSNVSVPGSPKRYREGKWNHHEHELFLQGLEVHKKDWIKIAKLVGTRSKSQVRSHAQKYYNRLENDRTRIGNGETKEGGENGNGKTRSETSKKKQESDKLTQEILAAAMVEPKQERKASMEWRKEVTCDELDLNALVGRPGRSSSFTRVSSAENAAQSREGDETCDPYRLLHSEPGQQPMPKPIIMLPILGSQEGQTDLENNPASQGPSFFSERIRPHIIKMKSFKKGECPIFRLIHGKKIPKSKK